jgi:hypothetical protein
MIWTQPGFAEGAQNSFRFLPVALGGRCGMNFALHSHTSGPTHLNPLEKRKEKELLPRQF